MKVKITTEPTGTVTYTTVCNHIGTAVSELPDYIASSRTMSGIRQGEGCGNGEEYTIFNADGSINTGYHPLWMNGMADADKKR